MVTDRLRVKSRLHRVQVQRRPEPCHNRLGRRPVLNACSAVSDIGSPDSGATARAHRRQRACATGTMANLFDAAVARALMEISIEIKS